MDLSKFTHDGNKKGPSCTVGLALTSLPEDRADLLRQVLALPNLMYSKVEEHSKEDLGVKLGASTVSRHVRGKCQC